MRFSDANPGIRIVDVFHITLPCDAVRRVWLWEYRGHYLWQPMSEACVLIRVSAELPAGALAALRKQRLGAGHVGGAEIVVLDFCAFERNGLELADCDFGHG